MMRETKMTKKDNHVKCAVAVSMTVLLAGFAPGLMAHQRDRGLNQPGAAGNRTVGPGLNQPGAAGNRGVDPGVNQPGAAGNRGLSYGGSARQTRAVHDPGFNQPGAAGNVGRDPGVNQPGRAGNRRR